MKSATLSERRISSRTPREDGEATKAKIIETAGQLFAENGYAETTSKQICEAANTNITSVNYHFGSREGLYEAVIARVQEYMFNSEFLLNLAKLPLPPKEKLLLFIDTIINVDLESWQIKFWARETVAPSSKWEQKMREDALPKMDAIVRIVSDMTGIPVGEPELGVCMHNTMAPIMLLLVKHHLHRCRSENGSGAYVLLHDPVAMSSSIKDFVIAGIQKIADNYAKKGRGEDTVPPCAKN